MIRGSIDLGTNTCLMLIAEIDFEQKTVIDIKKDLSTVVRLGQGVDQNKKLHVDAMKRTLDCLREYKKELSNFGIEPRDIRCVATAQARDAENGSEFLDQVWEETGFKFEILSGQDEAQLSFNGALLDRMSPKASAVIDIGGGSTEYMSMLGGMSVNMGAVRMTERFLKSDPVTDQEFWDCQKSIDEELSGVLPWSRMLPDGVELLGVAGTVTSLGAWHLGLERFDRNQLDGLELTVGDIHRMVEELKWRSVSEKKEIVGMDPDRADVILAGALILWRSMELLKLPKCKISTRGLRFGILFRQ